MSINRDEINARKEGVELRKEEVRLLERRLNIEKQLSQEGDKRTKNARDLKNELDETNVLINRNSDKQVRNEQKINKEKKERLDKEHSIERVQKDQVSRGKESRSISKSMLKILDSNKGKMLSTLGIDKEMIVSRQKFNKEAEKTLQDKKKLSTMSAAEIDDIEATVKANNGLSSIEKDLIDDISTGNAQQMSEKEILAKLEEKGLVFSKLNEKGQKAVMEQVKKIHKASIEATDEFQKGYQVVSEMENVFDGLIDKSEKWGAVLTSPELRSQAINAYLATSALTLGKDMFTAAKEVRQELGLGVGESAKLGMEIGLASRALGNMGGDASQVKSFAVEINKEFGNLSEFSTETAMQFAKISASTGMTGDSAAKLAKSIQIIQGGSLETSLNMIETFESMARVNGVSSKLVLEDIAGDTELFAKYAKDGGKNIAAASIEARKLGMNLSTVAGIAESLLDFESSITKEMEAEVLIGRNLNLDKARNLSYTGDLAGLAKEVQKQAGSQAEFERMSLIQKKALADAMGTNVADLGKMVAGEKTSAQLAEERVEREKEMLDMNMVMNKLSIARMLVEGTIATYKAIQTAQTMIQKKAELFSAKRGIVGMGAGIIRGFSKMGPWGAAAGAAIAFGIMAKMSGMLGGMAKGGIVGRDSGKVAPSDTIPTMLTPGEVVLNAGQQKNVANSIGGTDMTKTNQLINRLVEQNERLLNKLIKKTGDLALAS
tara:strand:- start:1268 stop:3427 length:2160 start_codon:yes stop_codon:yes gene_type:complete